MPVNWSTVAHYRSPGEFQRDQQARREQFQRETALPLGAALIVIVLLSLGLWWVILSAGSPLISALLGWINHLFKPFGRHGGSMNGELPVPLS